MVFALGDLSGTRREAPRLAGRTSAIRCSSPSGSWRSMVSLSRPTPSARGTELPRGSGTSTQIYWESTRPQGRVLSPTSPGSSLNPPPWNPRSKGESTRAGLAHRRVSGLREGHDRPVALEPGRGPPHRGQELRGLLLHPSPATGDPGCPQAAGDPRPGEGGPRGRAAGGHRERGDPGPPRGRPPPFSRTPGHRENSGLERRGTLTTPFPTWNARSTT